MQNRINDNSNLILKKVAIINLGCKVNKYESDAMAEKLQSAGMVIVEPEEYADVYIVNTCSVTNMAQRKSRQMLRRARKNNPEAVIIAAGCYVNAEHEALLAEDFVDVLVGNNRKHEIVQVVADSIRKNENVQVVADSIRKNENVQVVADSVCKSENVQVVADSISNNDNIWMFSNSIQKPDTKDYYLDINQTKEYEEMGAIDMDAMNHQRAYIKIQDGCNQFCSYCIIPYTRGRVRSRKAENIIAEIEKLAKEGIKEFVLTGIHISSYGVDFSNDKSEYDEKVIKGNVYNLGDLVYAIEQLPDVERIRLGSLEPRIITKEFLDKIGASEKLCPHFHLSLQSACNETLKRMNRKYTIEEFMDKCKLLREYFDRPAITTDVIVGFPGETEKEFATTVSNLEILNLYELHVFKYSVRSGTVAECMPNQVPEEIKNIRSNVLLTMTSKQKARYEQDMSGCEAEVLVEEMVRDGVYTGHTKRYIKVELSSEENIVNQIVRVTL